MGKKSKKNLKDLPLKEQVKPIFKERFTQMLSGPNRRKKDDGTLWTPEEEYELFEETILRAQRKSFRINTYKSKNPQETYENLVKKGLKLIPVPWSKYAYFLDHKKEDRSDLGNLFEHFLGEIYVQEATSMTPPEVLEIPDLSNHPSPDSFRVLDMCSSPGSKTSQIAAMMKNKGLLVANELDYKRLGPLKINLERSGFSNIVIINNDGAQIDGVEVFDRICLDAPCSGSGVIRKSPGTLRAYNPKKLRQINGIQLKLAIRAYELLKKGGIMTYSTCSVDPEENELLVKKFMEQVPEAKLVPVELDGLIQHNKLTEFKGEDIPNEITEKTVRIWPQDNDTNGFYLAKFTKPCE
ncbi:MAG: RsmB/NOP family class I SAM-dependent RNA methyltransferase [Nanoarchaeota archaeon]|nr:RsmB/NOP family class I SAM-dependent RNA methyltransferase [Nanoarchaeota archaeon]